MKKKLMSGLLAAAMLVSMLTVPAGAVDKAANVTSSNPAAHWFYDQLEDGAKKIYDVLYDMYSKGELKNGKASRDLVETGAVDQATVDAYAGGDRELFEDFSAAKDAFDLDLSEVWYFDSSYLCLRTGKKADGTYTASIGPGRADTCYVQGLKGEDDVEAKDAELQQTIENIVSGAKALEFGGLSESDKVAKQVRYVHDEVTKRISYRFENECSDGNAPYIRTIYALVTHEGVCEAYARSMQVILTKLDIPCVLVHGIQNSGDAPEMHMWNKVQIGGKWYAIDATWDDPVKYDASTGELVKGNAGNDGREHQTYLLVGMDAIGENWIESGVVSSGEFEFKYPTLEVSDYAGDNIYSSETGLHVSYTSMAQMDGAPAGQFKVDFNGKGVQRAADEDGLYLLIRMYDEHQDGTEHSMNDWYYVAAALFYLTGGQDNADKYVHDEDDGFYICTATCEYVEFAVTTKAPDNWAKYGSFAEWGKGELFDSDGEAGFYHGDGSDMFAQTERLYNAESKYEAAPYVLTQTPRPNGSHTAGYWYHVNVRWDDVLYHPADGNDEGPVKKAAKAADISRVADACDISKDTGADVLEDDVQTDDADISVINANDDNGIMLISPKADDRPAAKGSNVQVSYTTKQMDKDFHEFNNRLTVTPEWDKEYDGIVDDVTFHMLPDQCPHKSDPGHECSVEQGCPFDGVEFDFKASDMWADDGTLYTFQVEGAVGSRSFRVPNSFDISCVCRGACPTCYRSQGIDWNLWGMPTLLDNPDDLNLDDVVMQGVDGKKQSLADLQKDMKVDDLNGRLTLVVEPIGEGQGDRNKYNEVTNAFENFEDETGIDPNAIKGSSMYEITFTRLCKMIMLETGQSLRLQMGFPKDIDLDNLDGYVFKAYHFTRDIEGHCEITDPEHVHTGEITSVEEIPISVTPYGLVVLCDSFSPFEIVAMDADSVSPDDDDLVKTHNIIVNTDGNGTVSVDGVLAVGKNGFVEFKPDMNRAFTIIPKDGYKTDIVSFDGQTIEVTDNQFVLSYDEVVDTNDVLNVAFAPTAVKDAEKEAGIVSVAPSTTTKECDHSNVVDIPAKEPSCEEIGYTAGKKCGTCGVVLEAPKPIEALGHSYKNGKCERCGADEPKVTPPSSSHGSSLTRYQVVIEDTEHGSVKANSGKAYSGQKVTLTVTPDDGYELDSLVVKTLSGKELELHKNADGTYYYVSVGSSVQIAATFKAISAEMPYTDVPSGSWYYDAAKYLHDNGIMTGTSDSAFSPNMTMTRAQIVTMLWRMAGEPESVGASFYDVPADAWYAKAVAWAQESGIVNGYGDGTFSANDPITREQMASIIYRYEQKFGDHDGNDTLRLDGELLAPDAISVSDWAHEAMLWSVVYNIIIGKDDGMLNPQGQATRAEAATIVYRYLTMDGNAAA